MIFTSRTGKTSVLFAATICLAASLLFSPALAVPEQEQKSDSTAQMSKEPPSGMAAPGEKPITSGSDFKTGPVTDDEQLIKPATAVTKTDQNKGQKQDSKNPEHDTYEPQRNVDVNLGSKGPISIGALRVADMLEIVPLITRLDELKRDHVYVPSLPVQQIQVISVRQDLDEAILSAFLQSRRVVSELDRQIAGYDAVAKVLEENRDQAVRNNNILNFTSGGALAMTGGALSIGTPMKFQNSGNQLAVVAGGLSALISAYSLKLEKGGKLNAEPDPNMLAPVFGLTPAEPNKYPPVIWQYLNDHEPGQKLSRRQQLIDKWIKLKYIEPLDKDSSEKHLRTLSGTIPLKKAVTIDMLRDRIPMLEDVRATIAGMNEYLDEILTFVRKPSS